MSKCQHMNFVVNANVARLTDTEGGPVTGFDAAIKINCTDCNMPFQFIGLQKGSSFAEPMTSVDGTELRAPIVPAEEM
jgi:hypothetical protein